MGILARDVAQSWSWPWPERWHADAACLGEPLETFFPGRGSTPASFIRAREICAGCPVLGECRSSADRAERELPKSDLFGFVGGESPLERARRRSCRPGLPSISWAARASQELS
jgi:hypothetical protein